MASAITTEILLIFLALVGHHRTAAAPSTEKATLITITKPDGTVISSTRTESGAHVDVIVMNLTTSLRETFLLDLHLNKFLLSAKYSEKVCTKNGEYYTQFNMTRDHCYYIGKVRGYTNSTASVSTCDNITGFFVVNQDSYSISPASESGSNGPYAAVVAKDSDDLSNYTCGVLQSIKSGITHKIRKRSTVTFDRTTRIIELYVASDVSHFTVFGSVRKTTDRIKSIVNAANGLFNKVDMYLVLVGVEVWDVARNIVVPLSYDKTLTNWYNYKRDTLNQNAPDHDNACLFITERYADGVVGLAQTSSMCHSITSGALIDDLASFSVGTTAAVLTHEIGHNMGLIHDPARSQCPCSDPTGSCIMSTSISSGNPPTQFSYCSKQNMVANRKEGLDLCLFNMPEMNQISVCGNGIVEVGEDCDCGSLPSNLCNPTCCDTNKCTLVGGAACAMGQCCNVDSCQLIQARTVCRDSTGPCDIRELCNGSSPYCPVDDYRYNGYPCTVSSSSAAYCYEGKCQNRDSQCQKIWGDDVLSDRDFCYSTYNVYGTVLGSCKITIEPTWKYEKCALADVNCGQLFCISNKNDTILRSEFISPPHYGCVTALFDFGKQILTPGFVPNGAKCDNNKMCLNQKCIDVALVTTNATCLSTCPNGICSNQGQCKCESGLQYPNCNESIFTKPTTTSTPPPTPDLSGCLKTVYPLCSIYYFIYILYFWLGH